MDAGQFVEKAKKIIVDYVNNRLCRTPKISTDDVFIVWLTKVLGNNKAFASTVLTDGMCYEITYNGNEDEFYLNAFRKTENVCFSHTKEETV